MTSDQVLWLKIGHIPTNSQASHNARFTLSTTNFRMVGDISLICKSGQLLFFLANIYISELALMKALKEFTLIPKPTRNTLTKLQLS